ncbi:Predicted dithiol-disulfide oxidoreductase, DUF899 family [Microbacterium sp. cf046]|uniref:DUF899 family protein n=1 Tax=Microbacterium sp. cf046 TaxID=1761803 RepID=UPI0008EE69D6|nr:DUF899 family protein [Microbacterium sp. cf046]SFR93635.1 Predicted dithiol-disulfide oxidoreductase, DUF899 family [Microbacterium sp. cf046]
MSTNPQTPQSELPLPQIVSRSEWQDRRDELLIREKLHTRAGDALAAERRRLPMTPVDPVTLIGADGPTSLQVVFEDRPVLLAYAFMWHDGCSIARQCEGCTFTIADIAQAAPLYLAERDVTFAVLCEGAWEDIAEYREFLGWNMPWYSTRSVQDNPAVAGGGIMRAYLRDGEDVYLTYETTDRGTEAFSPTLHLLDLTAYGRKEEWEDSPAGWPQDRTGAWWRRGGRPVLQWLRTDTPAD